MVQMKLNKAPFRTKIVGKHRLEKTNAVPYADVIIFTVNAAAEKMDGAFLAGAQNVLQIVTEFQVDELRLIGPATDFFHKLCSVDVKHSNQCAHFGACHYVVSIMTQTKQCNGVVVGFDSF